MSQDYLAGSKDVDFLIAKYLINKGSPAWARFVHMLMILFRGYPGFLKCCSARYLKLMVRYLRIKHPKEIFRQPTYRLSRSHFWRTAMQQFASGEEVVFTDRHNGIVRSKLYMLGLLFGYYHIGYQKEEYEARSRRGRNIFSEYKLRKDRYTMKELKRMRMNLPGMWKETDEKDSKGEPYYVQPCYEESGQSWFKREIMVRRYGSIVFTKVIWTGNEAEIASALCAE
jgi:hypothetical protein